MEVRGVALLYALFALSFTDANKPPNIIFILADDLGWADISYNNPHVQMPVIDKFVEEGLTLNYSYVQSTCSPSRHALLTGRYPFRDGMPAEPMKDPKPYCMPLDLETLPEQLRKLGYSTHLVGKWHLGFCNDGCLPLQRGFDSHFGFYGGFVGHTNRKRLGGYDFWDNGKLFDPEEQKGKFISDMFVERARKILNGRDRDQPMFMMVSMDLPHSPIEVPDKFSSLYSWVEDKSRAEYLGMLTMLDEAVGRITQTLKSENMWENSIVVFTSDNGGMPKYGGSNYPLQGAKGGLYEGAVRSPTVITGGLIKQRGTDNSLFHMVDWYTTLISMAGGNLPQGTGSKYIDGIDQSDVLLNGKTGKRNEFIYDLNSHTYDAIPICGHNAIRYGVYKLIWGWKGSGDTSHPYPWLKAPEMCQVPCSQEESEQCTRVTDDPQCTPVPVSEAGNSYFVTYERILPEIYANSFNKEVKLYNIKDDPSEKYDLSEKMPDLVELLQNKLLAYMKDEPMTMDPMDNPTFKKTKKEKGILPIGWCSRDRLELVRQSVMAAKTAPRHFYKL